MSNDYEAMMDEIFFPNGGLYAHRTLRTIFDKGSAEWDQTDMVEKNNIIVAIVEHYNLHAIILLYKSRYSKRGYMMNAIDESLASILSFIINNKSEVDTLEHYNKYPCMKPWVGNMYINPSVHKRLLIIGESHYLPEESKHHLNINEWYQSNQSHLTDEERGWISTSEIIEESIQNNFPNKAHGIYKNFCKEINNFGFNYDSPADAMEHIAFYNYFQLPAEKTGESINIQEKDIEISSSALLSNIEEFRPEIVIFVSALAGEYGKSIVQENKIPCVVTPHPTCQWWNRRAEKYGGIKGREIISQFLQQEMWLT